MASNSISASDPRLANLAAAFGGVNGATYQDFIKIVNASPAYVGQLNDYLNNHQQSGFIIGSLSTNDGTADREAGQTALDGTTTITIDPSALPTDPLKSQGYQLAAVVAHEMGHALDSGLGTDGVVGEARGA
jgi:hypothetical protein